MKTALIPVEYTEGYAAGEAFVQSLTANTRPGAILIWERDIAPHRENGNPYDSDSAEFGAWREGWSDAYDNSRCTGDDSE